MMPEQWKWWPRGGTREGSPPHTRSHQGWPLLPVARSLALVGALFFLGACSGSTVINKIAPKVASVVVKPILGLAVRDAKTTEKWIDSEVAAGRLPAADAEAAKRCPDAVIALDALRTRMAERKTEVDGFRGIIYFGTIRQYGRGIQAEASQHLKQLAQDCLPLIPAERLMTVF